MAGDDPGGSRIVVRGVVRDDRGRPVAGARVTAVRAGDGRTTAAARADERGRFRLVLDGAGRWHVAARTADGSPVDRRLALELRAGDGPLRLGGPRAEGGVPATGDAGSAGPTEATSTASDGQGMTVHVPAVPGDGADHVDLRIVAADDGAGVAGAVVAWAGAGGRDGADRRDGAGGDAGMGGRARADADGTVRVPAGTAITVTAPGRAPGRVSAEDASAAARSGTVVVVPLRRTGVVAGRVLRDGRPVGGAAVTGPGGVRAVSDADGRWRLEGLAPGLVRVHATGPDGRAADARVLLAPAGVIDVDLDLEQP